MPASSLLLFSREVVFGIKGGVGWGNSLLPRGAPETRDFLTLGAADRSLSTVGEAWHLEVRREKTRVGSASAPGCHVA